MRSTSLSRVSLHSQRSLSDWLDLKESCADFEKKKAATMSKPSATLRRTAALKDLDYTTRWAFPIVFIGFIVIMHLAWDGYEVEAAA